MCRDIKTLFNIEPSATEEEINAAALQYVTKITGFDTPSRTNQAAFYSAVEAVARTSELLLAALETSAQPKGRGKAVANMTGTGIAFVRTSSGLQFTE